MSDAILDLTEGLNPEDYTPKRNTDAASEVPIFESYKAGALKKIERSIVEAAGRYDGADRGAHSRPTPSQNWRVKKKLELGTNGSVPVASGEEDVLVFVKVGISKIVVNPNGKTEKDREELGIKASALGKTLNAIKASLTKMGKDDGGFGAAFHKVAIAEAKPKTFPLKEDHINEGKNTRSYDAGEDKYFAVQGDFEDRLNAKGEVVKTAAEVKKMYDAAVAKKMKQIADRKAKKK